MSQGFVNRFRSMENISSYDKIETFRFEALADRIVLDVASFEFHNRGILGKLVGSFPQESRAYISEDISAGSGKAFLASESFEHMKCRAASTSTDLKNRKSGLLISEQTNVLRDIGIETGPKSATATLIISHGSGNNLYSVCTY